jgi:hypothetical protein
VRYTVPGDHGWLELPNFSEKPAEQQVYLCAYLPDELSVLGARGPWTNETGWPWYEYLTRRSPQLPSDEALVARIVEGLNVPNPFRDFATDGTKYTFSTLRPAAPPDGTLRLVAIDYRVFNGLVFLLVVAVGLAVIRRPLSHKVNALAALFTALVIIGVFLPTLSRQLLGGALLSALLVVLAAFVVMYAASGWRQVTISWAAWRERAAASPAPTPSPAPAAPVTATPVDAAAASPFGTPESPPPSSSDAGAKPAADEPQQGGPSHA